MLIDISFYDKLQNPNIQVITWHGGLTLTMEMELANRPEAVTVTLDVALPTEETGIYWGQNLSHFLDNYSDYQVIPDFERDLSLKEHVAYLNEWGFGYGVADNIEQITTAFPQYLFSDQLFVLSLEKIQKVDQPAVDGWRWEKWGPYIGTQQSRADYLYDEPEIEEIIHFEFIEVVPNPPETSLRYNPEEFEEELEDEINETSVGQTLIDKDGNVYVATKNFIIGYIDNQISILRSDNVMERYGLQETKLSLLDLLQIWPINLSEMERRLGQTALQVVVGKPFKSINGLLADWIQTGVMSIDEAKIHSPNVHKLTKALRQRGTVLAPKRTITQIKSNEKLLQQHLPFLEAAKNQAELHQRILEVAANIGVQERTVYKMLSRMDIKPFEEIRLKRDREIFQLMQQGLNYSQIAQTLNIGITSIKETLTRHNTTRHRVIHDGSPLA